MSLIVALIFLAIMWYGIAGSTARLWPDGPPAGALIGLVVTAAIAVWLIF